MTPTGSRMTQSSARRATSPRTRRVIRYAVGLSLCVGLSVPAWLTWQDLSTPNDGAPASFGELGSDYLARVVSSSRHDPSAARVATAPPVVAARQPGPPSSGTHVLQHAINTAATQLAAAQAAREAAEVAARAWHIPVGSYYISSEFGEVREDEIHAGLDFAGREGAPVLAARHGVVTESGWHGGYGFKVSIDHGDGHVTKYGHLAAESSVRVGDAVVGGQALGLLGNTGDSTGPHLHLELLREGKHIDPRSVIDIPDNRDLVSLG